MKSKVIKLTAGNTFIIRGNQVKQVPQKKRQRPSLGDLSLPKGKYKGLVGEAMGSVSVIIRSNKIEEIIHHMKLNKASDEYKAMQGLLALSKSNTL